jgi:IS5 family transposase
MFRTIGDQPSLWESLLPDEVLQLPEELARVDALLDDPVFSAAFACCFDPLIGRPTHARGVLSAADVPGSQEAR